LLVSGALRREGSNIVWIGNGSFDADITETRAVSIVIAVQLDRLVGAMDIKTVVFVTGGEEFVFARSVMSST
jgi:hypothetical protein